MSVLALMTNTGESLPLAILGIEPARWHQFQRDMEVSKVGVMTCSGGYGAFDIRPRRLVEMGYAKGLKRSKSGRREIWVCEFQPPWTARKFLASPLAQVAAFRASMRDYASKISRSEITLPPGCSLAGALAILHVGGTGALAKFPDLFTETKKRFERVKELF